MINLYKETGETLRENGKNFEDVLYVICDGKLVDKNNFVSFAIKYNYDSGLGMEEVNTSLMIVGNGWWLERHVYDGSEWFEYKEQPKKPAEKLEDINRIRA